MNRKDTILMAVFINAGLLAFLFMLAVQLNDEKVEGKPESEQILAIQPEEQPKKYYTKEVREEEVDHVLNDFAATIAPPPISYAAEKPVQEKVVVKETPPPVKTPTIAYTQKDTDKTEKYVDVTVKRGDALEKIARSNGTTVEAIKKANNLTSNQIAIGQVLKVPVGTPKSAVEYKPQRKNEEVAVGDAQYYTIKEGDNPWKIARQFHVNYDDILRLNHLDEEKARNMKIGDRIRVK